MIRILLIPILLALFLCSCRKTIQQEEFHSIEWKRGSFKDRGKMINALVDSLKNQSFSQQETITLLGNPDDSIPHRYYYTIDLNHMFIYDLKIFFDSTTNKMTDFTIDD